MSILAMAIMVSVDTDTWWHLKAGELILEKGTILTQDPFSFTMQGEGWKYPGWLAEVVLFKIYDTFQFAGLNLFTGLMVLTAFLFIWPTLEGNELLRSFVLILSTAASGIYWSARPQIFSFVFSGITIYLLERGRGGRWKSLWFMPLVMILWVNIHGGFAIGFILLLLYLLGELLEIGLSSALEGEPLKGKWAARQPFIITIVLVGLACLLALGVNPHGFLMVRYPFETLSIGALREYIAEWQSPDFHSLQSMPFLLLFILTWAVMGLSNRRKQATEFVVPIVLGSLSFTAARNIGLFSLASAPILARHAENLLQRASIRRKPSKTLPVGVVKGVNSVLFLVLGFATFIKVSTVLPIETNLEVIAEQIPISAFDYLEEHRPPGPIFNSYNWGGYLIWRFYPEYLSYVDGRTDLYGDDFLSIYLNTWLAADGWEVALEQRNIRLIIIEPQAPLGYALLSQEWRLVFEDDQAKVFTKP